MPVQFYASTTSPPCRAVWMALETLGVEYEFIETRVQNGGTRTPEYLKMNPHHTIPTMVDGDLIIVESRAALLHLARKYGQGRLLPNDENGLSLVEQRLFFDQGHMWPRVYGNLPVVVRDEKMYDQSHHDIIKNVMERLEEYVKPTGFVANSKKMTVADLAVLANYTTLKECDLLPEESYPYVDAWEKGCKNLVKNYEKTNGKGAEALGVRFKEALNKIGK